MAVEQETAAELKAVPCSQQFGFHRYPDIPEAQKPRGAPWRNNLTALSQRHNLFFVAYGDTVEIFRPVFPCQKVPVKPTLVLRYKEYSSEKCGYIDPTRPCAANHIIIGDLGDDEVLLIACDNGSVIGYRTVLLADLFGDDGNVVGSGVRETDLKPFFVQDVGASAWGLSIHKAARLIAVSSNTRKILVFAFALDSDSPLVAGEIDLPRDRSGEDDGLTEFGGAFKCFQKVSRLQSKANGPSAPQHVAETPWSIDRRKHHIVIGLVGHLENVPNIAFYDSPSATTDRILGANPPKVYLASIDIAGRVLVWDVWAAKSIFASNHVNLNFSGGAYWNVACIDPALSCVTKNIKDCHGTDLVQSRLDGRILDNSACIDSVADNSMLHPACSIYLPAPVDHDDDMMEVVSEVTLQSGHLDEPVIATDDEWTSGDEESADDYEDDGDDVEDAEEYFNQEEDDDVLMDDNLDTLTTVTANDIIEHAMAKNLAKLKAAISLAQGHDHTQPLNHKPQCKDSCHADKLPFNILVTEKIDICLIHDITPCHSLHPSVDHTAFHAVLCSNPMQQKLPPPIASLARWERLNMLHHIPELGVIAIGNQIGRVALLTLTRLPLTSKYRKKLSSPPDAKEHPAFKITAILPFKSQEEKSLRPEKPLLGIAVSPVQSPRGLGSGYDGYGGVGGGSTETEASLGRYRLLIMYLDHTILSYEISRETADDELLIL